MRRKLVSMLLSTAILALCIMSPTSALTASSKYAPSNIAPRALTFSGFRVGLTISDSLASCMGAIQIVSGFMATLTMELYRDDNPIKTWTAENATGIVELSKPYFVTSGHTYQVIVSVDVYNSSGKLIEHASNESSLVKY